MIWNLSKFYNTEERLTGLLRKISNEVNCDKEFALSEELWCTVFLTRLVA